MAFDPTQPFEVVEEPPAFDPSKPFEPVPESEAVGGAERFAISGLALPILQGAARIKEMAGGLMEALPIRRPYSTREISEGLHRASPYAPDTFEAGQRLRQRGRRQVEEIERLREAVGGGPATKAIGAILETATASAPIIPAAILGGFPAAIGAAGLQTLGSVQSEAMEAFKRASPSMTEEEAAGKAMPIAVATGFITAGLTAAFGGVEKFLSELGSGALKKVGLKSVVKQVLKSAGLEVPEETLDQASQEIAAKLTYEPNKTVEQIVGNSLLAGVVGGGAALLTGGAAASVGKVASAIGDKIGRLQSERAERRDAFAPPGRLPIESDAFVDLIVRDGVTPITQRTVDPTRTRSPFLRSPYEALRPRERDALVAAPREVRQLPAPVSEAGAPTISSDSAAQVVEVAQPQAASSQEVIVPTPTKGGETVEIQSQKEIQEASEAEALKPGEVKPLTSTPGAAAGSLSKPVAWQLNIPEVRQYAERLGVEFGLSEDAALKFMRQPDREGQLDVLKAELGKRGIVLPESKYAEARGNVHIEAVEEAIAEARAAIVEKFSTTDEGPEILKDADKRPHLYKQYQGIQAPKPAPASKVRPAKTLKSIGIEKPQTLIDEIEAIGLKLRLKSKAKAGSKAYYETDDYKSAVTGAARGLFSPTGEELDSAVQIINSAGAGNFSSPGDLLEALTKTNATVKNWKSVGHKAADELAKDQEQNEAFVKAHDDNAADPFNNPPSPVSSLMVGDKFKIEGEVFTVTDVSFDAETGQLAYVRVEDGRQFGVQNLVGAELIHPDQGEVVPTQKPPKLRAGEKQGDLMANVTEDFALAQEQAIDFARVQREKDAAAKSAAEARAIVERDQSKLFGQQDPMLSDVVGWAGRETTGYGAEGVRDMLDDPGTQLSPETRNVLKFLLGKPILSKANWEWLRIELKKEIEGGAAGLADHIERSIQMAGGANPETLPHELSHFAYYLLSDLDKGMLDQMRLNELKRLANILKLPSALVEGVMTSEEFVAAGYMRTAPQLYRFINPREYYAHIIGRRVSELAQEKSRAEFLNRNQTTWERFLARLSEIAKAIWAAIKSVVKKPVDQAERLVADFLAGKHVPDPSTDRPRTAPRDYALADALKTYDEIKLSDPARADQLLKISQAGTPLGRNLTAQQILADLQAKANPATKPTTVAGRYDRDIARATLGNPFIADHLARPISNLLDSANRLISAAETYRGLKANPASTPSELSAAAGYAFAELNNFLNDHELLTSDGPAKRTALLAELSEAIQNESDSIIERDVARVLFEDFKDIGVEIFDQKGDVEGRAAYQDALGTRIPTMRVLRSITAYVDMTPVRAGTITTVDQLYKHMSAEVQAKATWNQDLPTTIGASRDVIRNTLRIVLASERLRDDIEQSKRVIANKAVLQPTTKAIADIHQAVRTGNIDQAFTVFTRGVVAAGVDQRAAQDAVEFWAKRTRRRIVAIQSLDKVIGIADTMRNDPALMGEMREVFDDLGVKDILYDQTGSGVRFKARALGEPEVEVPFDNERASIEDTVANLKAFEQRLIGELATETDPRRANGIRWALDRIRGYLNPSVNPATARFLQSGPLVALQTIFGAIGHVDMIPKFVLEGGGGFAAHNAHLTKAARATIEEVIQGLMRRHEEPIKRTAAKALSSHGPKMLPMAYQRKILNPLAASRQNFADTRVLKMGDPIGNGHFVTKEDLAYVLAWENFERDLMASVNGTAKENLSSLRSVYAGILFDRQGRVRLPYATGPDTLTRHFPPGLKNWISSWKNNAAGREALIDSEPDRLLLGYADGVSRSDWEHKYAYVEELKDILRNVRTVPISTLDQLAREIHSQRILIPGNQESLANVKDNLLAEFGSIFDKLEKYDRDGQPKDLKSSIDVFGGDNSYNTERSHLVMPPGWYDYAGITAADRASHARAATWPFAEAHIVAVDALATSLEGIVGKMKRRIEDVGQETVRKETKEAQRRGDLIYDLEQAKRLAAQFRAYHGKLTNIRDLPELLISSDQPAAVVTSAAWQVILASLLAPAKSVAKNLWGGVMWATIDDMLLRDQNFFIAFPKNTLKSVQVAYRGLLATVANDHTKTGRAMLAVLNEAQNIVFVEHVAKFFLDSIKKHREMFGHTREIGSNANEADILANLGAMWGFRHMAGDVRQLPAAGPVGRMASTFQTMARQYARTIGHFTVQAGDVFINAKGIEKARLDEQHLKNIARRYGPILVGLANQAGRNPWDSTNPLNHFPVKALGGEWRARYKRKFFSQDTGLDFDAMLLDYYRKWTEARAREAREGKPEGFYSNDVPIFSREQFNQLAMSHSKYMNQAAFDNRLVSARTGKTAALVSTFLGYMANQTYEFLSFMNRSSRKGWTKGRLENLPWLVNVAIAVAIMSVIGRELYELVKRITEDKRSGFPMFVEVQNPAEAFRVIASSVADQVSVYGTAVNLALGMGYRTGFDPNQSILVLNLINDIAETGRKAWQTQDPASAAKDFALRWTWPLNVVGGRLPSQSGLREMRNMQNDLMVGAQNAGIETKRRGGGGERWNYTPLSPILAQAVNAIGQGDMAAFREAFSRAVEYERSKGSDDPEKAALRAIQARNPVSRVFGSKPTQDEMNRIMAGIPDNRRPYVQEQMANWDQAIQSVGGGPVAFVKQSPGSQAGAAAVAPTGGRPTRQAAVGMPALPMPVAGSRFGIRRVGARLPTLRRSVRMPRARGIRRPRIRSLRPARLRLARARRPRVRSLRMA